MFYQEKSSLFIFSSEFLLENLNQPGGLLVYLSKLFTTFYYNPLAGAAIISGILTLLILFISKVVDSQTGKRAIFIPFIIGIVLFYLQTDYRFLLINSLGLLLQLALYLMLINRLKFFGGWIPILIFPLWYFVTGSFAWVFVIMLIFHLISGKEKKNWIKILVLFCLTLLTIYISKEYLFFQTEKTLLIFPFKDLNTGSQAKLFLSVSAIISLLPLLAAIKLKLPEKLNLSAFAGSIIVSSLIITLLTAIGIKQFDEKNKQYFQVEKLFYQNKFDEVIAFNIANPPTNILTIFLNNIALSETGKLNDLLFHFPQSPDGTTLFMKWDMIGEVLKRGGYFYYSIGMNNEAQRWAFENMVMKGYTPEGIKMLIKTELINGNYNVASKYIDLLKQTIYYRTDAIAYEKLMFNDNAVTADPELGEKRKNKINTDFFSITDQPFVNIEQILASDSLNKKAFEYKLAYLLLKKDYKAIAKELPKFERYGFTRLPKHIEEVAVILPDMKVDLPEPGNILLEKNTLLAWNQYLTVFQQNGSNARAAEPALRKQYGNTFWYYVFYR